MALAGFKSLPLPIVQLSLQAVLKCGQSFRWSILTPPVLESDDKTCTSQLPVEYRLCLKDRVVCLRQSSDTLFYRSVFPDPQPSSAKLSQREAETLAWLNDYFQLNIDLVSLYKEWADKDKVFAQFQQRFEGIRMLRQDPWENLVSFICSANNNISRITKMVQNLCKQYSPPLLSLPHPFIPSEVHAYHPFPPPSALAGSGVGLALRSLGFGYRAEYIQRTAKMLVDTHGKGSSMHAPEASEIWLKQLRAMSTARAREELLKFVGVGRKVADCILLMSLDKREVVPVDTHVLQIAIKHYGFKKSINGKTNMTPKLYEEVNTKLFSIWGDYAGWAHSVLFTADLKAFTSYGLPPSSPSQSPAPSFTTTRSPKKKVSKKIVESKLGLQTPPITPSPSPLKRKLEVELEDEELVSSAGISQLCLDTAESLSLADRVKKRRRNV
ncbi:N-glycosylase/DNA lyase [Crassisporium funariophilum]|nr:N-glycosylase/DNA lyase [Crassisporium funariophilum]